MSRALYRLAGLSYRHRRLVLAAWLVVILAVAGLGLLSRGTTVDNFSVPGTQSQQALTQIQQARPALAAPATQVVFASTGTATVTGPAERAAIETSITRLRSGPQVAAVSDPFASGLVSKNGQVALATVSFTAAADSDVTTAALSALTSATAAARAAGLAVDYGGAVYPGGTSSTSELPELIGVLIALVVLLVMFGTLAAAGIPLIAALTVAVALCGLALTGIPFLAVMGFTGAGAVLLALLISVTLLPAMLGFAGQKILASWRPHRAAAGPGPARGCPRASGGPRWSSGAARRSRSRSSRCSRCSRSRRCASASGCRSARTRRHQAPKPPPRSSPPTSGPASPAPCSSSPASPRRTPAARSPRSTRR